MGKRKTTEEFKKELELKNSKVIIIGEYVNYKTKIKCKCPKCGNEWEGNP
jgi:peptide subunit release factor 1 (eRF1)